jgi:hypothetical protein
MIGDVAQWAFCHGDLFKEVPRLPPKCIDAVVCIRLTRWVIEEHGPQGIVEMLRIFQAVARQRIILTARVRNHPFAVSMDLINSALADGWVVARDRQGYHPDYRVLELRAS